MKKIVGVLLMAALLLAVLAGCGKSSEVKAVEEAIDGLGTITLDSGEAIANAQALYNGLSEKEKESVENLQALNAAQVAYDDLVEEAAQATLESFLDKINQFQAAAFDEVDVGKALELLDGLRQDLAAMDPDMYDEISAEVAGDGGKTLEENFDEWQASLEEMCIHNTTIAQPVYVLTTPVMGATLINDGGDFAAYNTYFERDEWCEAAYEEYKEYITQHGTITEEDDESFTLDDGNGNELVVRMSTTSSAGVLQVRVPSF